MKAAFIYYGGCGHLYDSEGVPRSYDESMHGAEDCATVSYCCHQCYAKDRQTGDLYMRSKMLAVAHNLELLAADALRGSNDLATEQETVSMAYIYDGMKKAYTASAIAIRRSLS